MPKLSHYEFLGNPWLFWLLCMTGVLIPQAVIYLIHGTVRVEHEVDAPEEFIRQFKAGALDDTLAK